MLFQIQAFADISDRSLTFYVEATPRSAGRSEMIADTISRIQAQHSHNNISIKFIFNDEYEKGKYRGVVKTYYHGRSLGKKEIKKRVERLKFESGATKGLHTYARLFKSMAEEVRDTNNQVVAIYSFLCPDEGNFQKDLNYNRWAMQLDLNKIRNSQQSRINVINFKRPGATEVDLAEYFDLTTKPETFSPRREVRRKAVEKSAQKTERRATPTPKRKPVQQASPTRQAKPEIPKTPESKIIDQANSKTVKKEKPNRKNLPSRSDPAESNWSENKKQSCFPLTVENLDGKDWHFAMTAEMCSDKIIYAHYKPIVSPSINLKIELESYNKEINAIRYNDHFEINGSKTIGKKFRRFEFRSSGKDKFNKRSGDIIFKENKHE